MKARGEARPHDERMEQKGGRDKSEHARGVELEHLCVELRLTLRVLKHGPLDMSQDLLLAC